MAPDGDQQRGVGGLDGRLSPALALSDRVAVPNTLLVFEGLIEAEVSGITRYRYEGRRETPTTLASYSMATPTWRLTSPSNGCAPGRRESFSTGALGRARSRMSSRLAVRLNNATLHLQDPEGVSSFLIADIPEGNIGGAFVTVLNALVTGATAFHERLDGLATGDRFILSMTQPPPETQELAVSAEAGDPAASFNLLRRRRAGSLALAGDGWEPDGRVHLRGVAPPAPLALSMSAESGAPTANSRSGR